MPDDDPNLMTIFAEALERTDPAARAAYLDGACGDDAALRQRVEALLAAHDGAGRFLEPTPAACPKPTAPETAGAAPASVPETRPRRNWRPGNTDRTARSPRSRTPRRPTAPADSSRARSSPAGTRCSKSSAKGGWAPSTGPARPNRSSGRWR